MDLILLVAVVVIIGFAIYALTTYVPLPPNWARLIQLLAFLILLLFVLSRLIRIPNVLH